MSIAGQSSRSSSPRPPGQGDGKTRSDTCDGLVDKDNEKAIHIYEKLGFEVEGVLREEFFINGQYRDVMRICLFQQDYLRSRPKTESIVTPIAQ